MTGRPSGSARARQHGASSLVILDMPSPANEHRRVKMALIVGRGCDSDEEHGSAGWPVLDGQLLVDPIRASTVPDPGTG